MEQLIESEADIMHYHVDNKMLYNVDFFVYLFFCFSMWIRAHTNLLYT